MTQTRTGTQNEKSDHKEGLTALVSIKRSLARLITWQNHCLLGH